MAASAPTAPLVGPDDAELMTVDGVGHALAARPHRAIALETT
ncbi:hypothetical protein ACWCQK_06840 [Streptomyces sp. NPDC002306]